ncbi:replication protein A 14 kDa subunit [Amborella trichopoda]|uniref:Replication factor A protein 3 n=1 Tax=Amborella trichopoda TaxID=13333 RepID=U5D3G2_AMBTC|nr:replication protein A 14 kDa subunit [Amborella trichopoda]ERN16780.1 hypothetical protein AMTR_s00057p00074460 [Amborella trichopoda]|eukprot:XP_006855313.1 replication protein A 14 kDa subunit [Amborella trichopoda]
MDISSPAVFVNGELLKMHTGRRVRSVVQVVRVDTGGFVAQTSDGLQLSVKATTVDPLSKFVEVIGVAEGNQTIRAEMCTNFGDAFDMASYNQLCQLANSEHNSLFI